MSETLTDFHLGRYEELKTLRLSWNGLFQDVVDFVLPRRQGFTAERSPGQATTVNIYDSTAPWALDQLAAGLHSYLTDPTKRWFKPRLPYEYEHLESDSEVATWLEIASNVAFALTNSQRTNFHPQAHELYLDAGGFGTGVFYVEEVPDKFLFRCNTFHLADCIFEEDEFGIVQGMYRLWKPTNANAVRMFGDHCPASVREKAEKQPNSRSEFLHVVKRRDDWEPESPGAKGKLFGSWYYFLEEKTLVTEGGYHEFPYMVPRWSKLSGEIMGRGPAILAMPDIKMVNAMAKTILIAGQKVVDPPLMLPDEGFLLPIKTGPGSLNFYNASMDPNHRITPLETKGRVDIGAQLIDSRRQHIVRSFYVDWMQLQEGPQMTATEVVQRTEEKMRLMAPAVSRLQSEFLDQFLDRIYGIILRRAALSGWKQYLPPPPDVLRNPRNPMALRMEYVSPVAKAMRMTQVVGFQRMLESLGQIAQAKPEVFDRIDPDGTVDFLTDAFDVTYQTLLDDNQVAQIRKQRSDMQQKMAQSQGMQTDSQTMHNMAKAKSAMASAEAMNAQAGAGNPLA